MVKMAERKIMTEASALHRLNPTMGFKSYTPVNNGVENSYITTNSKTAVRTKFLTAEDLKFLEESCPALKDGSNDQNQP